MVMATEKIDKVFEDLKMYGLIGDDLAVTRFGKDVLVRGAKVKSDSRRERKEYSNFYPAKFLGFQREV
jgi:hypothetical protein